MDSVVEDIFANIRRDVLAVTNYVLLGLIQIYLLFVADLLMASNLGSKGVVEPFGNIQQTKYIVAGQVYSFYAEWKHLYITFNQ